MHDDLLRHADWVNKLARHLTRHNEDAEDIAQGTFLRAVRNPPPAGLDERRTRAWLRTVVRNLVARRFESNAGRQAREAAVARPTGTEPFLTKDHAADLQLRVRLALRSLDDESRRLLVLRYHEDLLPRDIAHRLGVTGTVARKRLSRALAKLRRELERPEGTARREGFRGWLALLGFLRWRRGEADVRLPGVLPLKKLTALLSLILLTSVGAWLLVPQHPLGPTHAPRLAPRVVQADIRPPSGERHREVAGLGGLAPETATREARTVQDVDIMRGTVVDLHGNPVVGIGVRFEAGQPVSKLGRPSAFRRTSPGLSEDWKARSDGAGSFELHIPQGLPGRVAVQSERYALVVAEIKAGQAHDLLGSRVVVAERRLIDGHVVDLDGVAVARATVTFRPEKVSLAGCKNPQIVHPSTVTADDGSFSIADSYTARDSTLQVTHPEHGRTEIPLDANWEGLTIELGQARAAPLGTGHVVDAQGQAIPHAVVSVHGRMIRTNARGEFAILPVPPGQRPAIRAIAPGYLPATWEPKILDPSLHSGAIDLQLDEVPLTLRAQVLDGQGVPVPDCEIWITDPTPFGFLDQPWFVETLTVLTPDFSPRGVTDDQGHVEIPGLMDRAYELRIVRRATSTVVQARAAPGPERVVFELNEPESLVPRSGRVLNRAGEPLSGARVSAMVNVVDVPFPSLGGPVQLGVKLAVTITDALGVFDLPALPRAGCILNVTGTQLIPRGFSAGPQHPDSMDLVVSQPARLTFDVADRDPDQILRAYDESGRALAFFDTRSDLVHSKRIPYEKISFRMARASDWILPAEATELVVHAGGSVRERRTVQLSVDRPNHIHFH